jgi:hypothetical protein
MRVLCYVDYWPVVQEGGLSPKASMESQVLRGVGIVTLVICMIATSQAVR